MKLNNNHKTFLKLLSAGLWEQTDANLDLDLNDKVDWEEVYQLAEEQSVVGLVLAGIEHSNVKLPQELLLQWIGEVQIIEQQNKAMNKFIAELIEKMRNADIYTLLVKGQGIAQCYERPLWRAAGDVDLLLSCDNYQTAIPLLSKMASHIDDEHHDTLHKAFVMDNMEVELHGTLRSNLGRRIDKVIDEVQKDVFCGGNVRSWMNGSTRVFIPRADEDVVFVFSHILQHFFNGGIGLRQVCDWCRLLWTYKDSLDNGMLESRIKKAGLITEWKTFASLVIDVLGMPEKAMPLYSKSSKWKRKADLVLNFILDTGNMGHNRDVSYRDNTSPAKRKLITLYRVSQDSFRHLLIFPLDAFRAWRRIMFKGVKDSI